MTEKDATSAFKYQALSAEIPNPINNAGSKGNDTSQFSRIRLLTLEPGAFDEDIRIDLETVELNAEDPIKYEALSYAWGSVDDPSVVYLGSNKEYYLEVSKNLDIALRHLRYCSRSRKLWIDAICIDQSSLDERSQQVGIMGDIYRLAHGSVMWLGPSGNNSDYALELLTDLGSKVDFGPWGVDMKATNDDDEFDLLQQLDGFDERTVSELLSLFQRPWFDRLWIRQEIYLTQEKATMQIGFGKTSWHIFSRGAIWIWTKIPTQKAKIRQVLVNRLMNLIPLLLNYGASIPELRQDFGQCLCRDPRDRAYAVMNMLPDVQREFVGSPDYSLSALEVWRKTTLACINHYQNINLDILLECLGKEPFDVPSWIPKWEVDNDSVSCRMFPFFGASGWPFQAKTEYMQGDILRVLGVHIQVVKDVHPCHPSKPWTSTIKTFLHNMDLQQDYPSGGILLDACISTFTAGYLQTSTIPVVPDRPAVGDIERAIEFIMMNEEKELEDWTDEKATYNFHRTMSQALKGRSLIRTEDGHIGLAPFYVAPGDLIVAFAGCVNLMALRRSPRDASQYYLIGQCSVEGFMSSEAFLGPLPRNLIYVDQCVPGDNFAFIRIRSLDTGEFVNRDPRLESWPLDLEAYEEAREKRKDFAFKLDIDTFRKMNVEPEYFDLI